MKVELAHAPGAGARSNVGGVTREDEPNALRSPGEYLTVADGFLAWAAGDANIGGRDPGAWPVMVPRVELALRVAEGHMRMAELLLAVRRLEGGR